MAAQKRPASVVQSLEHAVHNVMILPNPHFVNEIRAKSRKYQDQSG